MLNDLVVARVDPEPTGVFRVLLGVASLWIASISREAFASLTDPRVLNVPVLDTLPAPEPILVQTVIAVWMLGAAVLITGAFARTAAVVVAGSAILVVLVDVQLLSNHLTLMIVLNLLLALGHPGRSLSIRPSGRDEGAVPYWPVFLLKTQLSTVYLFTALAKINPTWLSGQVLRERVLPLAADVASPVLEPLAGPLAVLVVLVELGLAAGLWIPPVRVLAAGVGIAFHLAIVVVMPQPALVPFGLMAVALYPLFFQHPTRPRPVADGEQVGIAS